MNVVLYTTHCPKCKVLEAKLKMKKVEYDEVTDADLMIEKGFMSAPMLEVDGKIMNFKDAVDWLNTLEGDMT